LARRSPANVVDDAAELICS